MYRPLVIFVSIAVVAKGSSLFANSASTALQMSHLFSSSAQVDVTIPGGYERAYVADNITDQMKCNVFLKELNKLSVQHVVIQLKTSAGDKTTTKPTNLEDTKRHVETTFSYMLEKDTLPRAFKRFISAQQVTTNPR